MPDQTETAGLLIEFVVDCPSCGEEASAGNTLFADYRPDEPFRIDLGMAASQMTFTCKDCGERCYSGDYEVLTDSDLG